MPINVNDVVQRYRLQLRQIWNECIWIDPELRYWDSVYAFRSLQLPLFTALVAHALGLGPIEHVFGTGLRVVPNSLHGGDLPSIQVNVSMPSSSNSGVWELLLGPFKPEDVQFTLVDFFDWTPLGYIDLRYCVVLIECFRGHEDRIGQHALIDVTHADVIWIQPSGRKEDKEQE